MCVQRVRDLPSAFGGGELGRKVEGGGDVERGQLSAAREDETDGHPQEQVQCVHLAVQ
jgi:hypothetical protein